MYPTSPTMAHGYELPKKCIGFVMRRLKNAFIVMIIVVGLIVLQCQTRAQWSRYIEQNTYGSWTYAKRIERRSFSQFHGDYKTDFRPNSNTINFNRRIPAVLRKVENVRENATRSNFSTSTEHTGGRVKSKGQWSVKSLSSPSLQAESEQTTKLRTFWLEEFTSEIPTNLRLILHDILLRDFERNSSGERCGRGYFRLNGMHSCRKRLQCREIEKLVPEAVLGNGVGKIVHASKWRKKYDVAVATLRKDRYQYKLFVDRVQSGVDNLMLAQSSPYATQVVGICEHGNNTVLVMEGCSYGNFRTFYSSPAFRQLSVLDKFKFAIQMVAEYDFLHRGLGLPRVHCDIHTIMQAFGQWVVSDDLRLFLNDLDEIPIVDKKNKIYATCECEPYGIMEQPYFLAPEIRYTQEEFDQLKSKKPVDESSDIWKIPDLTANILVAKPGKRFFEVLSVDDFDYYFKPQLKRIHDRCKELNPARRPSSKDILIEYLKVYESEWKKSSQHVVS